MKRKNLCLLLSALIMTVGLILFSGMDTYAADQIRETDVGTASDGNTIVLVEGTFNYLPKEDILARINEIRKEACDEGVPKPGKPSEKLTSSDYVPIKWSSDLEWIAQTRAAEATIHMGHGRPNGSRWAGIVHNGYQSWAEDLAWNYSAGILYGIDQWYEEKEDWVKQTKGAVTGHYTSIINPNYGYVGIGAFRPSKGIGAVAGELSFETGLDETQSGAQSNYLQKVEVDLSNLTIAHDESVTVHIGKETKANLTATTSYDNDLGPYWSPMVSDVILQNVSYSSGDDTVASVATDGTISGLKAGKTTVTAEYGGKEYTSAVTVEDHKWELTGKVDPGCTKDGSNSYKCSVCDETKTETVTALGHAWNSGYTVDVPATCTEDGRESIHCARCDATKDSRTIAAKGHQWDEEYTIEKEATCTEEGSESIHCSVCGEIQKGSARVIDKKPHAYGDWATTKEPTCTEDGSKKKVCEGCGDTMTEVIAAIGHTHSDPVKENAVDVTCDKDGSYDEVIYCSVCKEEISRDKKTVKALGHNWDTEFTVDVKPTCTKEGSQSIHCSGCDETKDAKAIPASGHSWNAAYTVDIPASYDAEGSESIHCSVCDTVKEGSARTIAKLVRPDNKVTEGGESGADTSAVFAAGSINKATVSASEIKIAAALGATTITLGPKVKKIRKGSFKGTNIKTVVVKSKKLKAKTVKGSLKGSKVKTIKVKVGKAKENKKYVRIYKKIFTQKNAGKKVAVK